MMKKIIKNISIYIIAAVVLTSFGCEDYLDVNKPSNYVDVEELEMKDIISPIMHSTVYSNYSAAVTVCNYTQYFGSYGNISAGRAQLGNTWSDIYNYNLPNIEIVKKKSNDIKALHYGAVADILKAVNLGLATDLWDNIPFSQASQPTKYPFPKFDTQEAVYQGIFDLLNSAITTLEAPDNSIITLGAEDIIYGGDLSKWLRAAYTFKARYQLRMVNKGLATPNDVLTSINKGFQSNADDFQLNFPENRINPWYKTNILSRKTGNVFRAPNDQLISLMNGTTYPFSSIDIDPRLPAIYEKEDDELEPWRGFMNGGNGESSDGEPANTFYKDGGFLTKPDAPLFLLTYAEAKFIKAEAAFLANGGNENTVGSTNIAYEAYKDGIKANMDKIGVDATSYLNDSSIDVGSANLMLHHIMKEKYIANLHNPETFTDFRRYDFSDKVFLGLALRLDQDSNDDVEMQGKWFKRAIYPTSEKNTNEAEVMKNWQEPNAEVWWDR